MGPAMTSRILSSIFSFSGASVAIGVMGFMAGFVTLFVDVDSAVSIKWLLLIVLVFLSLILIFLTLIYDLHQEVDPLPTYETPVRYVSDENVFVIRKNDNFVNNIVVGCYVNKDGIDRLAYLGVVHLVQDKVIQIKIRYDFDVLEEIPSSNEDLKRIEVRPVVPVTALQGLMNMEAQND
ncbi:hypothetical protein [Halomonas sp. HG01]|uniref:hypothetical protein n=1 Tax=Halomonas sp. HG01 TaxID=1609967 RepID=UPI000A5DF4FA|nr:hypothetical protein [Halomonas sp. HG01]